jgi:hypothetical protein
MSRFTSALKKPIVWIYLSVAYIWLLSISVLVATLGPPYLLALMVRRKNSSLFSAFIDSFHLYVNETAGALHVTNDFVWYLFILNIVKFPLAILLGFFVVKKKMWARNFMIFLLLFLILEPLILWIAVSGSALHFSLGATIEPTILLLIIFVLTRKSTADVFSKRMTIQ